ncbi:MAG: hypothetical protein ACE5DI_06325 [Candidatus Micrarchaeia archaeon]
MIDLKVFKKVLRARLRRNKKYAAETNSKAKACLKHGDVFNALDYNHYSEVYSKVADELEFLLHADWEDLKKTGVV